MPANSRSIADALAPLALAVVLAWPVPPAGAAPPADPIREMQAANVANAKEKARRPYHFGSQGPGDVFSNHASHSNRLIPIYTFGNAARLEAITGENSSYRHRAKVEALYGHPAENTVNPEAEYADQSELYRVQREAVDRGVKHLFIVWFDGLDWTTTQAAAVARTGKVYTEGKGSGLFFQDYAAGGSARFGYYVTSPTHDKSKLDVDAQTVVADAKTFLGGYDAEIAGPNPWTPGRLACRATGYLKGQSAELREKLLVEAVGGELHAYTDSAPSAAEFADGVKSYNHGINVADDGRFLPTVFHQLQDRGWKVGTATSVPFDHASPAAMYAHNVHRDDYQDLGRDMLGLPGGIGQCSGKDRSHPGLDVVLGTGFGQELTSEALKAQGKNVVPGNPYITEADKAAIDVEHGGRYRVVQTEPGVAGAGSLARAATTAAGRGERLFGVFGSKALNHLPYRTADGRHDPAPDLDGKAESYTPAELLEQPTLADMTRAALTVLASRPKQPFALFVEAGDVDFALHKNNLDNAIGAVYSGEEAMRVIVDWVAANSNWDESLLIVTADHGHYLVIDDIGAFAGAR